MRRRKKRSNVVLLMGAGAAASAGLATLKSIIDGVQGVRVPLDSSDPVIELVKDSWKYVKGQKGENATLEDLLALLKRYSDAADIVKDHHVFSEELKANLPHVLNGQFKMKWESALAFCFKLIIENYGPHRVIPSSDGFQLIHSVLRLLSDNSQRCLHLFTTNYDCLLNVMASTVSDLNFYSHISNEDGRFLDSWHVVNPAVYSKANPAIYIHRLHGCVGWFMNTRSPYSVHEVHGSGGPHLVIHDPAKLNQMAIKLISDEKFGNIPAFSLAFQEFCDELSVCDLLLVWGYSFRDAELLRNMVKVAEGRRSRPFEILYLDPYLEESEVIQNIRNAVDGLPAVSPAVLRPRNIPWVLQDGPHKLLDAVAQHINTHAKRRL